MGAASQEKLPARDAERAAWYKRYYALIPAGMAPLFAVTILIRRDWLEQLPGAVQWILAALAFSSTLFLLGLLILPWSRPLWLQSNFYDPSHWWGFLLPVANTVYVAAMATWGFGIVSGFLYLRGVGEAAPERPLDSLFNDSWGYYVWSFADAIPVLEIPQTFGWERSFHFTDHVNHVLLLLYKVALIGPVIATGALVWHDVRRLRSKTRNSA